MVGDWKRLAVSWSAPLDGHHVDALHNKRGRAFTVPPRPRASAWAVQGAVLAMARWNLRARRRLGAQSSVRRATSDHCRVALARGEPLCVSFPMNVRFPVKPRPPQRDRKSTRLNSSHGYISYAVFCLKKKKTNKHTTYNIYKKKTTNTK